MKDTGAQWNRSKESRFPDEAEPAFLSQGRRKEEAGIGWPEACGGRIGCKLPCPMIAEVPTDCLTDYPWESTE